MPYFELGVYHTKSSLNVGTLLRSAYQLGASELFTIGARYKRQPGDTVNAMGHLPLRNYSTLEDFKLNRPSGAVLVGVEIDGEPLSKFTHPKCAIYLLGSEDYGLPDKLLEYCNVVVSLESINYASYNVAVAGSIVMYHRQFMSKQQSSSSSRRGR